MYGIYTLIRTLLTGIPGLLFFSVLIIPHIPQATGLFSDGPMPGYCVFTAPLFQLGLLYAYPVTFASISFLGDDSFLSPTYYVILAVYTIILTVLAHKVLVFFMGPIGDVKKP